MPLLDTFTLALTNPKRKEQFAYMRSVPLKRLATLMAAGFFLFATIGLQSSLLNTASPHLMDGLSSAVASGLIAIAYVFVTSRNLKLLPLVVAAQILLIGGLVWFQMWFHASHPPELLKTVVPIYCSASIFTTAAAYSLFVMFIRSEGRFAFRAQTELALAHGIQQTLAPIIQMSVAGCELYGLSVPSDKVGGDLVDVVALPDGRAVAYIADIAGHGLQAGILMGMLKTAARTRLLDSPALPDLFDRLNRVLPSVKEANMYATAAALLLESAPNGCRLEYALAGHPAILHCPNQELRCELLSDEQFPLGLMPLASYRSHTTHAVRGDLIVITTDGVLEICNKQDIEFGMDALRALVVAHRNETLPELAMRILDAANAWGKQEDDQTLLLIRVL